MEEWSEDWQTWETRDLHVAYQALSREKPGDYPAVSTFEQFEHLLAKKGSGERAAFLGQLRKDYSMLIRRSVEDGMGILRKYLTPE